VGTWGVYGVVWYCGVIGIGGYCWVLVVFIKQFGIVGNWNWWVLVGTCGVYGVVWYFGKSMSLMGLAVGCEI
jgi:hypothetical protein